MKLLYIKRTNFGCEVVYNNTKVQYNNIPVTIINRLCIENMSTYLGRKEAAKSKHKINSLVPIIVNEDILLFPIASTRSYDNIWINYHEVLHYKDNTVTFRGGKTLTSYNRRITQQLKKCFEIAFL